MGPHLDPNGSRLDYPESAKIKLKIEMGPSFAGSPSVHKVRIHHGDKILEWGGDAGWD